MKITLMISLILAVSLLSSIGCEKPQVGRSVPTSSSAPAPKHPSSAAEDLAAWKSDLLEMVTATVSRMPLSPHVKTRSRLQGAIVDACLAMGQVARALVVAQDIRNWRKGLAEASVARELARRGDPRGARDRARDAERILEDMHRSEVAQGWREDRIRVVLAQVYGMLNDPKMFVKFSRDVCNSEREPLEVARARRVVEEEVPKTLDVIDATLKAGDFDEVRTALHTCVVLHGRFYDDGTLRDEFERRVRFAYAKLPLDVRLRMLMQCADNASKRGDRKHALELACECRRISSSRTWLPEHEIPLRASMAATFSEAGARETAVGILDRAWQLYEENVGRIVDIYRADTLLPLATVNWRIGRHESARTLLAEALKASRSNPNGRPRCEDFVAIVMAMLENDFPPEGHLGELLRSVAADVKAPW